MNIFDPKHKKRVKIIFGAISILVIVSMIILYSGFVALGGGNGSNNTGVVQQADVQVQNLPM